MASHFDLVSATNKQQLTKIFLVSLFSFILISDKISSTGAFKPIVETGPSVLSPNGKHVGVNVPPFFNMELDTRGPSDGLRMSQSVMSGLVSINMDREKGPTGRFRGPIEVKVGGLTMYNNNESPLESTPAINSGQNPSDEEELPEESQE